MFQKMEILLLPDTAEYFQVCIRIHAVDTVLMIPGRWPLGPYSSIVCKNRISY